MVSARELVRAGLCVCCMSCGAAPPPDVPEIASLAPVPEPPTEARMAPVEPRPAQTEAERARRETLAHGGRLFDNWFAEVGIEFVPDDPATKPIDGRGGPLGNGTLPDADGNPMPNTGHDYRLKNLLGWDLQGQRGLYGPEYLHEKFVLVPSLLADTDTRAHWLARLREGDDGIPAYGAVLSTADLDALVDFLLAVRDAELPRPDQLYAATQGSGSYALLPGGDAASGHNLFAERCSRCHGADGEKQLLEEGTYSLGSLARTHAYEVAMKIISGHPGSKMSAQVTGDAASQTQQVQDLLAALCDRSRYPRGQASAPDVPDGDPRCGAALR